MDHEFDRDVLSHVLDQTQNDELKVVADQVRREAASGRSVEDAVTQAQFDLGLSFADAKRVEAMASEPIDATAGLKSTLRKLRQQLNKHDNEDIEGMSKLITCIEGIEKQLDRKQKAKEERQSKKKPAEPAASDDEKEAEAAAPLPEGEPVKPGTPGDAPMDQSQPPDLEKPHPSIMKDPVELAGKAIDFGILKSKVAALKKEVEATWKLKENEAEFETSIKPQLLSFLETVEGNRMLVEHAEKKWSLLRVQEAPSEPSLDKGKLLDGIEQRIADAVKRGVKYADELSRSIKAMKGSPAYQTPGGEKAPYLKLGPTPKDMQNAPHHKVPPKQSSVRVTAAMLESLLSGFSEAVQELMDLVDIAESKLAPAY